jgi:HK97 family phage portal protein
LGLFQKMFGIGKPKEIATTRFEMISDLNNGFYAWGGNIYQSDIVRACIRPKSRSIGKLIAKHIRDGSNGFQVNPDPYLRFILEEPNPLMTGQVFQEKMATQLDLNNNAFAYIKRDELGYATEIYPIPCTWVEVKEGQLGDIYLKFHFRNGKQMTVPYVDIIHLRQDFNTSDFFGDSPATVLTPLMDIVYTTDQGIVKAIKNGAIIKWLLKFKSVLKQDDIDKQVANFVNNYLNIENSNSGAAYSDPRYDAEQVEPKDYVPSDKQMQETVSRLYSFFNTNEDIVKSKYDEDQWNAYYESVIEPVAMQLSGEYTRKLFSRTERGYGNKIIFEASNLQYASMATKLNLVQMVDRGALTPNEWRQVMNLPPIEGGDEPIRRLDTAVININPSPNTASSGSSS